MVRARVLLEVEFELGQAEDYPDEITSWEDALLLETDLLSVSMGDNDTVSFSITSAETIGEQRFVRQETEDGKA